MKKLFVCVLFSLLAIGTLCAADEIYFRNPGDTKVFHSNGLPFKSETKPGRGGVVPRTDMEVGDAIQTQSRSAELKVSDFTAIIEKNSLLSIQTVNDSKVILYLLDGVVNAKSGISDTEDKREFIVITPVSRFSATVPFDMTVSSIQTEESVNVNKGNVFAHNFLTKENLALRQGEGVNFLDNRNKIVSVDSARMSEEGAYQALGIPVPQNQTTTNNNQTTSYTPVYTPVAQTTPVDPNSKRVLSIKLTVGKDGAYVSPYSGKRNNGDNVDDSDTFANVNDVRGQEFAKKNPTFYDNIPEEDDEEEVVVSKAQTKKTNEPKNNTREEQKKEEEKKKKEEQKKKDDKKKEDKKKKEDEKKKKEEQKKKQPVNAKKDKSKETKKKTKKKNTTRPFGMGVDVGVSSVFDWDTIQSGGNADLLFHVGPYMRSENMDIRTNLEISYEYDDANSKFKFDLPQLKTFTSDEWPFMQKMITGVSQFVDDIVLGKWFYISRNYDLPIEYNSSNLNKHSAIDNEFRAYKYEDDPGNPGTLIKTYDDNGRINRKLPLLINFDSQHARFRIFNDNIENLSFFKFDSAKNNWKRDDASVTTFEAGFNANTLGMNIGAIHTAGAYNADESKAADTIIATARINTNFNKNTNLTVNAFIPLFDLVTRNKAFSIDNWLGNFPDSFAAGASFNIDTKKAIFNVGADINRGRLYTGIVNRRDVFAQNSVKNLYTEGIGNTLGIYPYMNIDFKFPKFALNVNADMPLFMLGNIGENLSHMVDWKDFDFLYRLNGGATIKFKFINVITLSAKLTLDNLLPRRAVEIAGNNSKSFNQYFKDNFSLWNLFPAISFVIDDGPIYFRVTGEQRNVANDGAIIKKFNPAFTFESHVSIGTDYILNSKYIAERSAQDDAKDNKLNMIFNIETLFSSSRYTTRDGGKSYSAFSVIPRVGFKHEGFTFVGKFEIENFSLPPVIKEKNPKIGDLLTSFVEEVDVLTLFKMYQTKVKYIGKRSVLATDQYRQTLKSSFILPTILDVTIPDTASFINGLLSGTKQISADASVGLMSTNKFYIGNIATVNWDGGFRFNDLISVNIDIKSDVMSFGFDLASAIGIDGGFHHGFEDKDWKNWQYVADFGFGLVTPSVAFKVKVGAQSGGLAYNMYDYLSFNVDGAYNNRYVPINANDQTAEQITEFADAEFDIKLSKTVLLNTEYYLPMDFLKTQSDLLLQDRLMAKLLFNTPIVDVYAVAEKRGFLFGKKTGWFKDVDNFGAKAGVEFKAEYATFKAELESAHFVYPTDNIANKKDFSLNIGVKFGFY